MRDATASATSRVLLVDPSVFGQSHLLVNTGFIQLASRLFSECVILANESHRVALEDYLSREAATTNLTFHGCSDASQFYDSVQDLIKRQGFTQVIFLNLEYPLFLKLNLAFRFRNDVSFHWVVHSHLLSFRDGGALNGIRNKAKYWLLFKTFGNSSFIVYADAIRRNFTALMSPSASSASPKIDVIFHPIGVSQLPSALDDASRTTRQDRFSLLYMVGWHALPASIQSTLDRIRDIAAANDALDFDKVDNKFSSASEHKVFVRDYRDRLQQIAGYDYILHVPADNYALQASGALMDAIIAVTPVIGITTDFSRELTSIIGQFGFFCDTHEDLIRFFETIDLDILRRNIQLFRTNLKNAPAIIHDLNRRQLKAIVPALA